MKTPYENIKELVAEGNIELALEALLELSKDIPNKKLKNDIIASCASYRLNYKQEMQGLKNSEIAQQKTVMMILSFTDTLAKQYPDIGNLKVENDKPFFNFKLKIGRLTISIIFGVLLIAAVSIQITILNTSAIEDPGYQPLIKDSDTFISKPRLNAHPTEPDLVEISCDSFEQTNNYHFIGTVLLEFNFDSDRFDATRLHPVTEVIDMLSWQRNELFLVVTGSTDTIGNENYNKILSCRRVWNVLNSLSPYSNFQYCKKCIGENGGSKKVTIDVFIKNKYERYDEGELRALFNEYLHLYKYENDLIWIPY